MKCVQRRTLYLFIQFIFSSYLHLHCPNIFFIRLYLWLLTHKTTIATFTRIIVCVLACLWALRTLFTLPYASWNCLLLIRNHISSGRIISMWMCIELKNLESKSDDTDTQSSGDYHIPYTECEPRNYIK